MKKLPLAALLLVVFLVLGSATGITTAAGAMAERLAGKLLFFVHVAQLYSREPDQQISMPVKDVMKRQVTNTWHAPRGTDRLHKGQDIFAPKGTPVLSATEGYIANIGENILGGQTVSVIGKGGRAYYYAHLDSYAPGIAEGDWVTPETVLGYVGTTGNAANTPPHLHFGVYAPGGADESAAAAYRPTEKAVGQAFLPVHLANPSVLGQAGMPVLLTARSELDIRQR